MVAFQDVSCGDPLPVRSDVLKKDDKIFFRLPKEDSPKKRNLRPGIVLGVEEGGCLIQLEEPADGIEESLNAFLHFEERRKFVQQSVQVVRKESETPCVFAVQWQGTPVSAESRQAFRVSCLSANIRAIVADEPRCEVVDVSTTGFAFYGKIEYEVGRRVHVMLSYDGTEYRGQGTIQSTRRMNTGALRYGVHCTDGPSENLAKSLPSISLAVQSEQLRRLSNK